MATSFEAASGSSLPNPFAPRIFTTTGDVAYVSARLFDSEHPDRIVDETMIYARGDFQGRYKRGSKRVGNVFTVVRDGGWPASLALYVEPVTAIPTSGQALAPIYEIDFRTLANQAIAAAGAYTIDGLQWWAKEPVNGPFGNVATTEIVSGGGMRIAHSLAANLGSNGDLLYRAMYLPLANVPGFNADAPLLVRAKFAFSYGGHWAGIGLVNTTADATTYGAASRSTEVFCGTPQGDPSSSINTKYGNGGPNQITSGQASNAFTDFVCGVYEMFPGYRDACSQIWNGVGAIPSAGPIIPQRQGYPSLTSAKANRTICFFVSSGAGAPREASMTHLSISQPKVAA